MLMNNTEDLEKFYVATSYEILELGLSFRIGTKESPFYQWFEGTQFTCWAFVGACNPNGILLTASENEQKHRLFCQRMQEEGKKYLEGIGIPDTGNWPPEQGLLLLDISLAEVFRLAKELNQLAIIYATPSKAPQLYWTSSSGASGNFLPG